MRYSCDLISEQIDSSLDVPWRDHVTPQVNCSRYIQMLLEQAESPFVLILDGVETLYTADAINQEFFKRLREWHDQGAAKDTWKKIRLVISYSSENYGKSDLTQSPFNIGSDYELTEFNESNIFELTKKYRLNWDLVQVRHLMTLIGGHPYLVNLALYHFAIRSDLTLDQFLNESSSSDSIYQSYLDSLINYFERNAELKATLELIINSKERVVKLEDRHKHILYGMGVVKYVNSEIKIRCELYQQYFQKYFLLQSGQ